MTPQLKEFLLNTLKNNSIVIKKNTPGLAYLEKAQKIIISLENYNELYKMKPYLNTNQNQHYVSKLILPEYKSACVVASSGDTLFETIRNGINFIDAIDINDLQLLVLKLRLACIKSLNNSEFENFLLYKDNKDILSFDLYSSQISSQILEEDINNFWTNFLKVNSPDDILNYYIKGGIEQTDITNIRSKLPYIKKRRTYITLRDKLKTAQITTYLSDILKFLLENKDKKYDYIDLSNILLFIYQYECDHSLDKYISYLEKIKIIFDNNLNDKATFAIDYMFGFDLTKPSRSLTEDQKRIDEFYQLTYEKLNNMFDLQSISLDRAAKTFILDGKKDVLLYTRKN